MLQTEPECHLKQNLFAIFKVKVTAVSNSLYWTFCVLIRLRWNFIWFLSTSCRLWIYHLLWGAADAEIKVPSGENTELKRSPFKARSKSVSSHTCYAYCQGFLSCLFLHFRSIHLHFSKTSPDFSQCWLWLTHGSCVGPQNKIGQRAWCGFPCWVPAEYK